MFEIILSSISSGILAISTGFIFSKRRFSSTTIDYFETGLLGFIYLSFISLFLNFFIPLSQLLGSIILIFSYIIFFLIALKTNLKFELIKCLTFTSLISLLLILYSNINRPDAGLYHLPYNAILNENKILIGIYNINFRFAHSSIIQYLSGIYNNHFFSIEFLTMPVATIFSFYFFFSIKKILYYVNNDNNYLCLIYLLLLIFSVISFNNYTNFGNDASSHIYFFLLILIFLENNKKIHENREIFFKIVLISLFLFAQKLFMVLTFILVLYTFIIFKKKIWLLKDFKFYFVLLIFLSIILKNILTSSCILFPIKQSCFQKLSFYNEDLILKESQSGEAWSKGWSDQKVDEFLNQDKFIVNFNWLDSWFGSHFFEILNEIAPFLIIIFLIYIFLIFLSKKQNYKNYKLEGKNQSFLLIFSTILVIVWFLKFPLYRYGESFIAVFLTLLSVYCLKKILFRIELKKITLVLIFFCFSLLIIKNLLRIYKNYNYVSNSQPWPKIYTLSDTDYNEAPKYKKILNYKNDLVYYFSGGKECMYSQSPCSNFMNENVDFKIKNNYKIFYLKK